MNDVTQTMKSAGACAASSGSSGAADAHTPEGKSQATKFTKQHIVDKLFDKQKGLCWICKQPMLRPNFYKSPNRWMANLDHLEGKREKGDYTKRPIKASHTICNSKRHHLPLSDPKVIYHIEWMKKRFAKPNWWKGVVSNART